jgi:hypothetical protein
MLKSLTCIAMLKAASDPVHFWRTKFVDKLEVLERDAR